MPSPVSAILPGMNVRCYIAYFRVSTDRQGKSGLGLDAQKQAVRDFLAGRGELLEAFTEVESTRKHDRPQLAAALDACRKHKAVLIIAKLDQLARNVFFISGLMESGVEFIAVDMPEANRLTLHILAAVAEHEREMISQRTKAALQAAKARGTKLGSPDPQKGAAIRSRVLREKADRFAANVLPVIRALQAQGITSNKGLARALNARGIPTANKRQWYDSTVKNVLHRSHAGR
jgi:DNA invertase Pin-like site-specific DNA recombinase